MKKTLLWVAMVSCLNNAQEPSKRDLLIKASQVSIASGAGAYFLAYGFKPYPQVRTYVRNGGLASIAAGGAMIAGCNYWAIFKEWHAFKKRKWESK